MKDLNSNLQKMNIKVDNSHNESSANSLFVEIQNKNEVMFNDGFFVKNCQLNSATKLSFANFLFKQTLQPIKNIKDEWTNVYDLIINDKKLLFTFLSGIKNILIKDPDANFDYVYAIPRKSTIKTKYGEKKVIILQVGIQYQEETAILTNLGYNYKIDYILEGDEFSKTTGINDKGEFFDKPTYTQKNTDLLTKAVDSIKTQLTPENYMTDIVNVIYPKIQFAIAWIFKKNEKPNYILISKQEMFASLNSSLVDSYSNDNKLKDCWKNKSGLLRTLDIAIIHIIYKRIILKSNEDEAELQEIEQIEMIKKAENIEEKECFDESFLNVEKEQEEKKEEKLF